jgi:UDPglucose--hexose-1-phosphate uridylyltransferase
MNKDLFLQPHRRFNPLTRSWVQVSPNRNQRPWQGQVEKPTPEERPVYDPTCYLCPGNQRAGGKQTPGYESVYVFDNDYPGVLPTTLHETYREEDLLLAVGESGLPRVLCFSPRHDLTLALMQTPDIRKVVDAWVQQYLELGSLDFVNYVQIFENRGAMMGASNPHPHGQIWSIYTIPDEPTKELEAQAQYLTEKGRCMLCDYTALELKEGTRIVCQNDSWLAVVPFWATWPFETMLLNKRHVGAMDELTTSERDGLVDILKRMTTRFDNLFETSFPYSMGFHQSPTDGRAYPHQHLHAHFYPPLLRSATIRKFMVGFEMLGNPQRDITPESAAERLSTLSEVHYTQA